MYLIPKWSGIEGEEEHFIEGEWICATFLTALNGSENMPIGF